MGIFSRKKPAAAPVSPGSLEDRIARVEFLVRQLDEDLDELHDRFKRFAGRQAKRQALDVAPVEPALDEQEAINQRIRAQRAGFLNGEH